MSCDRIVAFATNWNEFDAGVYFTADKFCENHKRIKNKVAETAVKCNKC